MSDKTSRLLFATALLLCACFAHAQNVRSDGVVSSRSGQPAGGAFVAVCTQPATTSTTPCSPKALLCASLTDLSCTSPNPVQADGLGNYHFYVPTTSLPVTIQFYGQNVAPYFIPDQTFGGGGGSSPAGPCGAGAVGAVGCLTQAQSTVIGTGLAGSNFIEATAQGWFCDVGTGIPFPCMFGINNLQFTTGTTVPTIDQTSLLNVALQYATANNLGVFKLPPGSHTLTACQAGAQVCLPLLGHVRIEADSAPGVMYSGGEVGGVTTIEVGTPGAYAFGGNQYGLGSNLDPCPEIDNLTIRDATTNHQGGGAFYNTNCNGQVLQNVTVRDGFRNLAVPAPVSAPTLTAVAGSMAAGVYQAQLVHLTSSGPSLPSPIGSVTLGGPGSVQIAIPSECQTANLVFPTIGCGAYMTTAGGTNFCIVTPAPTYIANSDGSLTPNWPITTSTFTVSTAPCGSQMTRNPPALDFSASTAVNYAGQSQWGAGGFNNQPRAYNLKVFQAARAISVQSGTADLEVTGFQGTPCDITANNCVSGGTGTIFIAVTNGLNGLTGHTDGSYVNSIPLALNCNGCIVGPGWFSENDGGGQNSTAVIGVNTTKNTINLSEAAGYATCVHIDVNSLFNDIHAGKVGGTGCGTIYSDDSSALLGECSSFNKCEGANPGVAGTFLQGHTDVVVSLSNLVWRTRANADTTYGFTMTGGGYMNFGIGGSTALDAGFGRCSVGSFSFDTTAQCNGLGAIVLALISGQGLTSTVTITGSNDFNGAGNNLTGGLILRGADETGTGPTSAAPVIVRAGGVSSSTGIPGLVWVAETYRAGSPVTKWNLGCQVSGNNIQIQDCPANATGVIGVQFTTANPVIVIKHGNAFVNVSGSATLHDTLCTSGTAGVAVDSGGNGPCPFGTYVGVVLATSGTFNLPTNPPSTQTASSSLPLVDLGPFAPGTVVYNTQSAATTTNIGSTTMFTTGTVNTAFQFWATVSLTASGTGCTGNTTVVLNVIYRDPSGVAAVTKPLGTVTLSVGVATPLGDVADFVVPIWAIAAQPVLYSTSSYTAGAGCTINPTYQVTPRLVLQ